MASIQELYVYPFHEANQGEQWDKNRPMQQWARPLEPGEDPADYVQLWSWVPVTRVGTEVMRVGFLMLKGDAARANIITAEDPANQAPDKTAPYWTAPPEVIPMRELEPGESLRNSPFGLVFTDNE